MNISSYVDQLSSDIGELMERTSPSEMYNEHDNLSAFMEEIEEHVSAQSGSFVAEFSGIRKEHLPDPDLLDDGQLSLMLSSLMNLLNYYRFHPVFPDNLPELEMYRAIREHWTAFRAPTARFDYYYEFCNYEPKECPFPEYCEYCKDS